MARPVAWYREFRPCAALRADISAFFSFVPDPIDAGSRRLLLREIGFQSQTVCSPRLADGHVSIVFELNRLCSTDGRWRTDSRGVGGTVLGPQSRVGRIADADRPEMIGVLFNAARAAPFLRIALSDLTDTATSVGSLWGSCGERVTDTLCELDELDRIDFLETFLLARHDIEKARAGSVDLEALTARARHLRGRISVDALARGAGVSRQYLSRQFRERIGIGPKLYARLARFQSGLVYAGTGHQMTIDWASMAADMGYADQSHMIAEFRQFSGLTPGALAEGIWFHPFIERARAQYPRR